MSHPNSYSDEWLKDYCDNEGTERAIEKLDFDKIENPKTKVFEAAGRAWIDLDNKLAGVEKHLGLT